MFARSARNISRAMLACCCSLTVTSPALQMIVTFLSAVSHMQSGCFLLTLLRSLVAITVVLKHSATWNSQFQIHALSLHPNPQAHSTLSTHAPLKWILVGNSFRLKRPFMQAPAAPYFSPRSDRGRESAALAERFTLVGCQGSSASLVACHVAWVCTCGVVHAHSKFTRRPGGGGGGGGGGGVGGGGGGDTVMISWRWRICDQAYGEVPVFSESIHVHNPVPRTVELNKSTEPRVHSP
jgi:uncharacterized membrane protein YgcG